MSNYIPVLMIIFFLAGYALATYNFQKWWDKERTQIITRIITALREEKVRTYEDNPNDRANLQRKNWT